MESRDGGDFDLYISRSKYFKVRIFFKAACFEARSNIAASRPEATPMDFAVRPQSKIDPDEIRGRAKQVVQDQRRLERQLAAKTYTSSVALKRYGNVSVLHPIGIRIKEGCTVTEGSGGTWPGFA
ncbi:hypothetical protein DITRI_Ditri04bG0086000 [Diplodiscus trichospermus]